MKVWIVGFFGFVLHVTVTACNDSGHKSQSRNDSGTDVFDSRGSEVIEGDAGDAATSDGEAPIPLIITPQLQSLARRRQRSCHGFGRQHNRTSEPGS